MFSFGCCLYFSNLQQIRNISKIGSTWYVLQISDISVTNVQEHNFGFTVTANKIPVAVTVHPRKFIRNLIFLYLNGCVSFSNTGIFRFQLIFVCLIKQTARRKTNIWNPPEKKNIFQTVIFWVPCSFWRLYRFFFRMPSVGEDSGSLAIGKWPWFSSSRFKRWSWHQV